MQLLRRSVKLIGGALCTIYLILWVLTTSAAPGASPNSPIPNNNLPTITPQPPNTSSKAFVLMDANSGIVLASKNMHGKLPPASLTKLMTLYVASQALREGRIKLNDSIRISEKAWRMDGSRMFLNVNTQTTTQDLLNGIIVASGNDACVALAEHIAGSEDVFAQLMNQNASRLGMQNSHYIDSTGLPSPQHYSSAYDLAVLTRAIINDFPDDYVRYKQKWISFNHIRQPNRNRLLWRDPSVDGLKTGHTSDAGYCLVSSALRSNMRLIAVVMGSSSDEARTVDSEALLNWGFRFFETHKLFSANQKLDKSNQPRVWLGKNKHGVIGFGQDVYATIPVNEYKKLQANIQLANRLSAPLIKGHPYGTLHIVFDNKEISTVPLVALDDNPKGGLWTRFIDSITMLFVGWLWHSDK